MMSADDIKKILHWNGVWNELCAIYVCSLIGTPTDTETSQFFVVSNKIKT